jgi:hypothetical protein
MCVLVVIALLVGAAFMILFVLAHLAREFSRLSFHSPPDLDNSDDWDCAQDDFDDGSARRLRADAHSDPSPKNWLASNTASTVQV